MLQIDTLPLGDYQTNCYIVRPEGAKECLVIDPGYEPEIILSFLKEKGLELSVIALTHGHFDRLPGLSGPQGADPAPHADGGTPLLYRHLCR